MKLWKRNTVITCIVLFICAALYLSWSYGRSDDGETPVFDPAGTVSQAPVGPDTDPEPSAEPGGKFDNYFTETRLSRKQARDAALTILNQAAENTEASQAVLDNVTEEIRRLSESAMSEASIEALVKAKGFQDCVAFISQDGIKVVVSAPIGGLTAADAAKIKDIILSESNVSVSDINLVPVESDLQ